MRLEKKAASTLHPRGAGKGRVVLICRCYSKKVRVQNDTEGLKIPWGSVPVWVQVPPRAPFFYHPS